MQWRTLGDVYLTTNLTNSSADLMRMAKAAYCFNPQTGIIFPRRRAKKEDKKEAGGDEPQLKPSLKLGEVAAVNGVVLVNAHDAIHDTKATVDLAQQMQARDPQMWDHMMGLHTARGVSRFIQDNPVFMWTRPDAMSYYTSAYGYVVHKGEWEKPEGAATNAKKASKEIIIFNLACDPRDYMNLCQDDLVYALKKSGSNKPFQVIKTNDQPVLWPYMPDPVATVASDTQAHYSDRQLEVSKLRDPLLKTIWFERLRRLEQTDPAQLTPAEAADLELSPARRRARLEALPLEQLSAADKADLTLAQAGRISLIDEEALTRRELEYRQQLIQSDRAFALRLSRAADQMWPEKDTGPQQLEDRLHDAMKLTIPGFEAGQLRTLISFFHSRDWKDRDSVADQLRQVFPRPSAELKEKDPVTFREKMGLFEHGLALSRLARIIVYERELIDGAEYIRDPEQRRRMEEYVRQRLTTPATNARGYPVPKHRTIDIAVRAAHEDIKRYREHPARDPDEQRRRIELTEACLDYYETLRPGPVAPPTPLFDQLAKAPTPAPAPTPVVASPAPTPAFAQAATPALPPKRERRKKAESKVGKPPSPRPAKPSDDTKRRAPRAATADPAPAKQAPPAPKGPKQALTRLTGKSQPKVQQQTKAVPPVKKRGGPRAR
jgi:hypothetical protein